MKKLLFLVGLISNYSFAQIPLKFNFGTSEMRGFEKIGLEKTYTSESPFGYVKGTNNRFFTLDLPEGNYDIIMYLGSENEASETTIKVENRRLVLEKVQTSKGEIAKKIFTVNLRNAKINETKSVKLKPRELTDRKSTRLNSSHRNTSRMPSSA